MRNIYSHHNRRKSLTEEKNRTSKAFIYAIYGIPHDMLSRVAYRRTGTFKPTRIKAIKCPYCGKVMTTVDETTKLELYRCPRQKILSCHEYRKCHSCHEVVGFKFNLRPAGL